jgi:hypothetical protein
MRRLEGGIVVGCDFGTMPDAVVNRGPSVMAGPGAASVQAAP